MYVGWHPGGVANVVALCLPSLGVGIARAILSESLDAAPLKIVAGSDAGWGVNPFGGFVAELEAMVTVGMPSTAVLLAATRDAARSLGVDHLVGTLEAGKKADVLVVAGDPTRDVGALRDIQSAVLGGEVVSP